MDDPGDSPPRGTTGEADPFGPEWETWAEDVLADSPYNSELGTEMAKDARRLSAGEIDPETFWERHHESVTEEFEVDLRTVPDRAADQEGSGTTDETDSAPEPGIPSLDSESSRRRLLGALGGMVAAGSLASAASSRIRGYTEDSSENASAGDKPFTSGGKGDGNQLGMVIDTERCIACLKCSLACKRENNTDRGMHWVYVFRYQDQHFDDTDKEWLTRPCQHCSDPSCTYVCPTQARHKRWYDDGLVLTDYDRCVGCKYCMVACPYGVNFLGEAEPTELSPGFEYETHGANDRWVAGPPPEGVMGKCTFCVHRQDSGDPDLEGTTACEDICPANAIHFGDLTDPTSDPRTHLRTKPASHKFELLDQVGNEPNVIYIGKEPSMHSEPIPGPTTYEDRGMEIRGDYSWLGGGEH